MECITNLRVYELAESIYASGYAKMAKIPQGAEWELEVDKIRKDLTPLNKHVKRAITLANAKGGGHNNFLNGILVSFDLTLSNKVWVEAERYKFLNFITSQSTMHCIHIMNIEEMCGERVDPRIIEIVKEKVAKYNKTRALNDYRDIMDNLPSGLRLTARVTTNYRCLRNMYEQRHTHRLELWQEFCDIIKTLPMAREFIIGE